MSHPPTTYAEPDLRQHLLADVGHETRKIAVNGPTASGRAPLTHLAIGITHTLVEAGFVLHDCAAATRAGGVCLTPSDDPAGVVVTWATHHAIARDRERVCDDEFTHETMNYAIAEILGFNGWHVRPSKHSTAHIVTGHNHPAAS